MSTEYIEVPFFDFPDRIANEQRPPSARETARALVPSWRKYAGRRAPCDPCLQAAYAADRAGEKAPIPRHARQIRSVKATGEEAKLCDTHAEPIKAVDEAAKKAKAPARAKRGR